MNWNQFFTNKYDDMTHGVQIVGSIIFSTKSFFVYFELRMLMGRLCSNKLHCENIFSKNVFKGGKTGLKNECLPVFGKHSDQLG